MHAKDASCKYNTAPPNSPLGFLSRRHHSSSLPSPHCRWQKIDDSEKWQVGAFDGMAVAYATLSVVALVSWCGPALLFMGERAAHRGAL